jgi:predicted nucleotidyltransferase
MVSQMQIDSCISIAKKHGASSLVLFGSALVHPENANDIDFIIDGVSGMEFAEVGVEMEDTIGMRVDLVPMHPSTRFVSYNLEHGRILHAS